MTKAKQDTPETPLEGSTPKSDPVLFGAAEARMTPMPQASPVEPPLETKVAVPFAIFASLSGLKVDQIASFRHFAQKSKLGPMAVESWRLALQEFLARPCK
jgi:hypothetical protein